MVLKGKEMKERKDGEAEERKGNKEKDGGEGVGEGNARHPQHPPMAPVGPVALRQRLSCVV